MCPERYGLCWINDTAVSNEQSSHRTCVCDAIAARSFCAGEVSFMQRLQSAVGRKLPWHLPVVALLEEDSFDRVYVARSASDTASVPGAVEGPSVVGGTGAVRHAKLLTPVTLYRAPLECCGHCAFVGGTPNCR